MYVDKIGLIISLVQPDLQQHRRLSLSISPDHSQPVARHEQQRCSGSAMKGQ